MKSYKVIDKIQKATAACRNGMNTMSNKLENATNRLMVKRVELLDKELEFLRTKLSNQIPASK